MTKQWTVRIRRDWKRNWTLYLLIIPVVIYYLLFHYKPMYGALIAFQDYKPAIGFGKKWVGFAHFIKFVNSHYFWRLLRNTFLISFLDLIFIFPSAIILALLLNEIGSRKFKVVSQMCLHLPHFVSIVVLCGLVKQFCMANGLINDIMVNFGWKRTNLLTRPELYRTIYVISDLWQGVGWRSLIFVAALSGVDVALYDAAKVDGANKIQQIWHVTLPGILSTIIVLLILNIGRMMSVGYEKTLLLYNSSILETSDLISTYVYRYGLVKQDYSYSTAIGVFNAFINILLLISTNYISRKVADSSLW